MTQTISSHDHREDTDKPGVEPGDRGVEPGDRGFEPGDPGVESGDSGLILGRPVEDRSFEAVEASIGMAAGLAVGTAVAGPIGTAVGGLVGAAAGIVLGEALERAVGPAATTTHVGSPAASSSAGSASVSLSGPTDAVRAGRSRRRGFITYPTNYLLAVADTTSEAASAVAALSGAGFPASGVVVLAGSEAGEEFGRLGPKKGPLSGLVRLIQFTTMDQTPDFRVYEDALLEERTIVAVHVIDADRIPIARDVLVASGLYFLNFYGRWSTMEVSGWRGPELDQPDYPRR